MPDRKVEVLPGAALSPQALLAAVLNDHPEKIEGVVIVRFLHDGDVAAMWSDMGPEMVTFAAALLQRDALKKAGGSNA